MPLFNKRKEKISMMNRGEKGKEEKKKKKENLMTYNNKSVFFMHGTWSS